MAQKEKAFISPTGTNHRFVANLFDEVRDMILHHYGTALDRNPLPEYTNVNDDMYKLLDKGASEEILFEDLRSLFEKSMNHISPNYIGHMDSMPTLMSILSETCIAAINNNMLGLEMSPVFTRMEASVLLEFSKMFGFSDKSGGMMGSGGSLTNLQAMLIARNVKLKIPDGDLSKIDKKPIIFASEIAHASVEKNMMILGLGRSNLEKVRVDDRGKMSISHLRERIEYHFSQENQPFCVVATLATTSVGSVDPMLEIADICRMHNLWLHADAVYGGAAILSRKYRHLLNGIEQADSITFNAQKWMNIAKTCSLLLFKDYEHALAHFKTDMPYYSKAQDSYYNLGEISIQGSRTTEILKLWLSLRHLGKVGYETLIDRTFDLAFYFEKLIDARDYLEKYASVETNTVLFRIKSVNTNEPNQINIDLQNYLLREKGFYFSVQTVNSCKWLKFLALNPYTDKQIISDSIKAIDQYYLETGGN